MDEPRAQRTLVKSPPELWAEVSDPDALAGHLGAFGDIRITRLEAESTVAWEGDRARGTVELEPSGWGTRVTLTARLEDARDEEEEEEGPPEATSSAAAATVATPDADAPTPTPLDAGAPTPTPPDAGVAAPAPRAVEQAAAPSPRRGLLARLFGRRSRAPKAAAAAPADRPEPQPDAPVPATGATPPADRPAPGPPAPPDPRASAPAAPEPAPAPTADEPAPLDAGRAEKILVGVLDDLGAARHRPFSRG